MDDYGLSLTTFLPLALGGIGVYLLLPRGPASDAKLTRWTGGLLATVALVLAANSFGDVLPNWTNSLAFYVLGAVSVASAALTITSRNPVFSALWFALVLLSNSGLYLLQGAEFLAAATIIIYAGAIIVTFLFVIMLAQPRGTASYDRYSREPLMSCLAGVILGATLIGTLHYSMTVESLPEAEARRGAGLPPPQIVQSALESGSATNRMPDASDKVPTGHVLGLGRTLFLDHYLSIEVIGMLLLVAVVGAVLIIGNSPPAGSQIIDRAAAEVKD